MGHLCQPNGFEFGGLESPSFTGPLLLAWPVSQRFLTRLSFSMLLILPYGARP